MKNHQFYSLLFWLNKTRGKNDRNAIYLRLTIDQKRVEISTCQYINPNDWNKSRQRVNPKSKDAGSVNRILDIIQADIHRHFSILTSSNDYVSAEMIKNAYLGVEQKQYSVQEIFNLQIKLYTEKATAKLIAPKTLTRLVITKSKVIGFMKHRFKLTDKPLCDLKFSFASDFFHYLTVVTNMGSNTAMKYIKITKQVFKAAVDNEWVQYNPIGTFKCTYNEPERERLTMEEIMKIYYKDFSIKRLEETRDVFIFCCFTGFAFNDVLNLTRDNIEIGIDGEKWICKDRQKTKTAERIPLLPMAMEILSKYAFDGYCIKHNRLLPVCCNQRFNGYLKEIAVLCDVSKYLTSHTARHTFATTVTLENDMPIETVSQMLGHKSIRTTQIYAKITQLKVSNNMKTLKEKLNAITLEKNNITKQQESH